MSLKPILLIIALLAALIESSLAYNLPPEFNLPDAMIDTSKPTILPPPAKKKPPKKIIAPKIAVFTSQTSVVPPKPSKNATETQPLPSNKIAVNSKPPKVTSIHKPDDAIATSIHKPKITAPIAIKKPEPKSKKPSFKLELRSNSDIYRIGDTISFSVRSNKRCYLTVFNVGTTGKTTVLYPNAFKRDNYINKNTTYTLPSNELMPVEAMEISKPKHSITDEETIIAICRISKTPLFKQKDQFKRYNFREFPPTVSWKDQITKVGGNEEVRMEISFKVKPALDRSKVDFLKTQ